MTERPSFQFYPADWRSNAKLLRCSRAARAVWMDILCVLHDSDEYGVSRWPLKDLASAANAPLKLVKELVDKGVLKGSDTGPVTYEHIPKTDNKANPPVRLVHSENGPCWFSSRMLKDEWRKNTKGLSTRFSQGHSQKSGQQPLISQRQITGSSSSTSSSSSSATAEEGQETANQLAKLSAILGLPQNNHHKHASNLITLHQLKSEGCDYTADILPAAQRAAKGGRSIESLRYIIPSARESRDGRKALSALPTAFEPTNETGWRDRLRVWNARAAWHPKWGPAPDQADCKCPAEILAEITGNQDLATAAAQ